MKQWIWLSIFFTLFVVAGPMTRAEISCDLCREAIEGRYVEYKSQYKSRTVCLDCKRTNPACAACKIPHHSQELLTHKGEQLCKPCLANAKFCTACQHRISGRYYKYGSENELYCQRCYAQNPKCSICGKPRPRGYIDSHSGACRDCLPKLDQCTSCGQAITGKYYEFQFKDGKYCEDCKLTRHSCHICGAPVGEKYWKYPDGRSVCTDCNSDAVIDVEKIREIMKEVEGLAKQHLGLVVETPYQLTVQQLNNKSLWNAKKSKEGKDDSSPLFGTELGLYRRINGKSEIFLLYGLPRAMIYETAGHEYAHAWQAENAPMKQSDEVREGFAQWVGAKILKIKGFNETLTRLEARHDHPYGTGYHRFKHVEKNLGKDGVIEYARKTIR